MPVPESGTLRLRGKGDGRGLNKEVKGNITDTNVSLHQLAIDAGFSTPDNMSEFYGYTSYEQPSISGTSSTSNITDTRICVVSPTYSNPTGGSIERGFYVGTSTNATSNPWYSKGTSTSTSTNFNCNFTSLSGGTTYRIFAGLRDTCSPTRFTEAVSSMRSQTTQPSVSYSSYWGFGAQNMYADTTNSEGTVMRGVNGTQYNHVYYGWSGLPNGRTCSWTSTAASCNAWEDFSSPNYSGYGAWRSGASTQNRKIQCACINYAGGNPGGTVTYLEVNHTYSHTGKPSNAPSTYWTNTIQSQTWTGENCSGFDKYWPSNGSTFSSGKLQNSQSTPNQTTNFYGSATMLL